MSDISRAAAATAATVSRLIFYSLLTKQEGEGL